jgi:hypothetical protein
MLAGLTVAFLRLVRGVVRDGSAQGIGWIKALDGMFRRRAGKGMAGKGTAGRPRDPQEPKGRPTPRRADAERTRRERLRGA